MAASEDVDETLALRDGRVLAWHQEGPADATPVLFLQGTPGSRLMSGTVGIRRERGLRVISADRPGYGGSTRLPGRGFAEVVDDLVELLDHLEIEQLAVIGRSGGGPHVLAMCARHPDRVRSATVVSGAAPTTDEDLPSFIPVNVESYVRWRDGGWDAVYEYETELRASILGDPVAVILHIGEEGPAADQAIIRDPAWQRGMVRGVVEALRQGAEGWADETVALNRPWDFDPADVQHEVVWWHARNDANQPLAAVERYVASLPNVDLRVWENAGHMESWHREAEIVAGALARRR